MDSTTKNQPHDRLRLSEDETDYESNLKRLRNMYHSQCLFNNQSDIAKCVHFQFDSQGAFRGELFCNELLQGYDSMVHGGILAAIIDASMAQCLMGHNVVAYTAELSIKYHKPFMINTTGYLTTVITTINHDCLYSLECEIVQNKTVTVTATSRFFKVN